MLIFFTFALFIVLFSTTIFGSGEGSENSALMDFVWKLLNVVVLIGIIYKFARKPIAEALGNNADSAKQLMDEAKEAEQKTTSNLSDMRLKISNLEKEALEMVESAKKDAESEKTRIIEEGKQEILRMTEQASFALKQEKIKAENDLRHWIAEESMKLARGRLEKEMNPKHQKN